MRTTPSTAPTNSVYRPSSMAWIVLWAILVTACDAAASDTATTSYPAPAVDYGQPTTANPDSARAGTPELLTESFCADDTLCGDGFVVGGLTYRNSCGPLDVRRFPVSDQVLVAGEISWSDDPIEVRSISSTSPDEFLAVWLDGDLCQDERGLKRWYIASTDGVIEADWVQFCELIGATLPPDATSGCVEN